MKTHFEKESYFENESAFLKKGHCLAQNSILFTNLSHQIQKCFKERHLYKIEIVKQNYNTQMDIFL